MQGRIAHTRLRHLWDRLFVARQDSVVLYTSCTRDTQCVP